MNFQDTSEVNKETIDWRTDGAKSVVKNKLCRMGSIQENLELESG